MTKNALKGGGDGGIQLQNGSANDAHFGDGYGSIAHSKVVAVVLVQWPKALRWQPKVAAVLGVKNHPKI